MRADDAPRLGSDTIVRRNSGLYGYERALIRRGLGPVAGADEAGRGACAGPLVVAAVVLRTGQAGEIPGLADSKLLTPLARERVYAKVMKRAAAVSVIVVPSTQIDSVGLHVCNVMAMRRAVAGLTLRPAYVLTDGFPVPGLDSPGLAMWKGDRVAGCIAAASVVAKVTRDRMMTALHDHFPAYDFATHKGYSTAEHQAALLRHGPCEHHRFSYINVRRAMRGQPVEAAELNDSAGLIESVDLRGDGPVMDNDIVLPTDLQETG